MVGIIQEQHAERCRLFAQWQQFDWPILHDPINVLEAAGVPIVVAIDEHGIVRKVRPKLDDFEESFLNRSFTDDASAGAVSAITPPRDHQQLAETARDSSDARDWRVLGDCLALWQAPQRLDEAISAYERAVAAAPDDLSSHFRLGVCLRMRHETERRRPQDFSRAVAAWEQALDGNPNQYIWRRRIQQYGPRLIKPYPFYDWVDAAEADIAERGESPIKLAVRPTGAELAAPSRDFERIESTAVAPDPRGAVFRDMRKLIQSTVTIVPSRVAPGETARVHISLIPNRVRRAHWNNESEPLRLWIEPPTSGAVTEQLLATAPVKTAVSSEVRRLDFEVQVPKTAQDSLELSTYALYYVCEDVDGQCLFLRQDIPIEIPVKAAKQPSEAGGR